MTKATGSRQMRGSTSPGIVMLMLLILGLVGWMAYTGEGDVLAVWSTWPWWGKALAIGLLVLFLAGDSLWRVFDWPKRPPED